MARVKTGYTTKQRHKKILKRAKGYFGSKHRLYKTAKEQLMHSGQYAYRDRRHKKRDFRKLWITRINAECRVNDISYSKFINGLNKAGVIVNRKMLSEMAIEDPKAFANLVKIAKDALNGKMPEAAKAPKATAKKEEVKTEKKETVKKETVKKETTKKETTKKAPAKKAAPKKEEDLSSKTVAELKEMAKKAKIEGYTSMKKADLIKALK
ncbi:MAG: 50S ribosomal protein L20 [Bacilli bacterium]|nr:50S ribosomal protein L20 [Bacilli bacterium]